MPPPISTQRATSVIDNAPLQQSARSSSKSGSLRRSASSFGSMRVQVELDQKKLDDMALCCRKVIDNQDMLAAKVEKINKPFKNRSAIADRVYSETAIGRAYEHQSHLRKKMNVNETLLSAMKGDMLDAGATEDDLDTIFAAQREHRSFADALLGRKSTPAWLEKMTWSPQAQAQAQVEAAESWLAQVQAEKTVIVKAKAELKQAKNVVAEHVKQRKAGPSKAVLFELFKQRETGPSKTALLELVKQLKAGPSETAPLELAPRTRQDPCVADKLTYDQLQMAAKKIEMDSERVARRQIVLKEKTIEEWESRESKALRQLSKARWAATEVGSKAKGSLGKLGSLEAEASSGEAWSKREAWAFYQAGETEVTKRYLKNLKVAYHDGPKIQNVSGGLPSKENLRAALPDSEKQGNAAVSSESNQKKPHELDSSKTSGVQEFLKPKSPAFSRRAGSQSTTSGHPSPQSSKAKIQHKAIASARSGSESSSSDSEGSSLSLLSGHVLIDLSLGTTTKRAGSSSIEMSAGSSSQASSRSENSINTHTNSEVSSEIEPVSNEPTEVEGTKHFHRPRPALPLPRPIQPAFPRWTLRN